MSVLIKGIDMPRNIDESLIFAICDDKAVCISTCSEYEAVEVKPHGRLIDADDVLTQTQKGKCENSFEMGKEYGWNKAIEYVGNFAPTVIEAEEE